MYDFILRIYLIRQHRKVNCRSKNVLIQNKKYFIFSTLLGWSFLFTAALKARMSRSSCSFLTSSDDLTPSWVSSTSRPPTSASLEWSPSPLADSSIVDSSPFSPLSSDFSSLASQSVSGLSAVNSAIFSKISENAGSGSSGGMNLDPEAQRESPTAEII